MSLVEELIAKTDKRRDSFSFVKSFLDRLDSPFIVETGCVRAENDFAGAGSSTLIWDAYVDEFGGNYCSIDITPEHVEFAKSKVRNPKSIILSDSVSYLQGIEFPDVSIDLLYLDSYDLIIGAPHESALHHLYELLAASHSLRPGSLVMVDDNPSNHEGKGKYIKEYMDKIGKPMLYCGYQYIWEWY